MPLVITLREGQDFFVGEDRFVVARIYPDHTFKLAHSANDRTYVVTDKKATEVLPDVFVSAGDRPPSSMARIVVDAPHEVLVLRGDKKRNPPPALRRVRA